MKTRNTVVVKKEDLHREIGGYKLYRLYTPSDLPQWGMSSAQYMQARKALSQLRARYVERAPTGTACELNNIKRAGEHQKKIMKNLERAFEADCEEYASFKISRSEFLKRWANHYYAGLDNVYYLTIELNSDDQYLGQY